MSEMQKLVKTYPCGHTEERIIECVGEGIDAVHESLRRSLDIFAGVHENCERCVEVQKRLRG